MQWPEGALWSGPPSPAATILFSLCSSHWPPPCSHLPTLLNAFALTLPSPWNTPSLDSCPAHCPHVFVWMSLNRQAFPELHEIAVPPAPTLSVPLALPMAPYSVFLLLLSLDDALCICLFMVSLSAVKWEASHASWEQGPHMFCFAVVPAWCLALGYTQ